MSFIENGFEIVDDFIEPSFLESIKSDIELTDSKIKGGGIRNAEKKFSTVQALIDQGILSRLAKSYLGKESNLVRVILFDKTPTNNWLVTWHQDRTIAVSSKVDVEGWGPWSIKGGCHHVQPGIDVLNSMVTFRLHIDESTEENGCLRVIPKSHKCGVMSQAEISSYVQESVPVQCVAKPYSALVMRPHILHASSKATNPSNRRVLHVEYSSYTLPNGLKWA